MKKNVIVSLAAFLIAPYFVFGEVIEVDVGAWTDTGTGMTVDGWEVSNIDSYADGGALFKSSSAYALSPVYEDVVTQIVMSVKSSSSEVPKKLTITPTVSEGADVHVAEPTLTQSYVTEIFQWSDRENVRQFRLQESAGATGNWGVKSLTVYTDRIEPPTGLREDALYRDAFAARWDPVSEAVNYQLRYASVTRTPPSYETVAEWDFSSLTNTTGNSKYLEVLAEEFPTVLNGVTGTNLGLQKYDGGHLQIGKDNVAGAMELRLGETDTSRMCFITNWRHDKDSSSGCSAFCLGGDGSTNAVISLTAGAEPATDVFALPDEARTLRVESPKSRRVEILSVVVAADYVPASVTTNGFTSVKARTAEKTVKGLAPGEWLWSVRSYDAEGRDSPWSPLRTLVLDPAMPHCPLPGFCLTIR